ncbi:MAG TPA: hypothetical protein VHF02_06770, partial [Luteimonas sp.]|nr:hypothetical protein [Luteimonas sp.]
MASARRSARPAVYRRGHHQAKVRKPARRGAPQGSGTLTDRLCLYSYWRSSAAYRVRIGLNLKGLPYEIVP